MCSLGEECDQRDKVLTKCFSHLIIIPVYSLGEEEWDQTEEEEHATWENITGLITGGTYEVRVVAISGNRKEPQRTPSVIKTVVVGGALGENLKPSVC